MTDNEVVIDEADRLLTPAETAALWHVDVKTITRWEQSGRFPQGTVIRTPGEHRRFRETTVRAMLASGSSPGRAS